MGPKRPAITNKSIPPESSNALVRRGVRTDPDDEDLSSALVLHSGKRIVNTQTTTKALIKRAIESGGELILAKALTGPEKLRLKAETLAASAVREPFDLDELFRIADAQFQQQLTLIDQLQDPLFFCADITETIVARPEFLTKPDALRNPAFICSAIGSRIHNVYYMAGTWKQVLLLLREIRTLTAGNLHASNIPKLLKTREHFRDRYILLYRLMSMLVAVYQKSLAMATAASPLYSRYFQRRITDDEARSPYMTFRQSEAMGPMKSLLDSIVMELVFPDSEYPLHILYLCLKDTLDSSPKDASRFSQRIYDALGDLSETVRFLDMVTTTLSGPDTAKWTNMVPPYTPAFDAYLDAEYLSIKASRDNVHLRPYVNPISKTEDAGTLNLIWKNINLAYQKVSGFDIDHTWQLGEDRKPSPQWSYSYDGSLAFDDGDSEYTDDDNDEEEEGEEGEESNPMALVLHKSRKGKKIGSYKGTVDQPVRTRKARAITQGEVGRNDSDEEPPELVSASDDSDDDEVGFDDEEDEEKESVYDSDEEAELERMFDQVMDADEDTIPELIDAWGQDASSGKKSRNPFVKLLKRLSGRMFSLDPTLNSRREFGPEPPSFTPPKSKPPPPKKPAPQPNEYSDMPELVRIGTSKAKSTTTPQAVPTERPMPGLQAPPSKDPELPRLVPSIPPVQKKHKVTVEEVEDEDEVADKAKKKKKKKKKTKKAKGDAEPDEAASPEPAPIPLPTPTPTKSPPPAKAKNPSKPASASTTGLSNGFSFSSISLHHPAGQSAQSARSYLAETGQINHLQKGKTRGETSETGEPSKQGFFAKISAAVKGGKPKDEAKKLFQKENILPRFSISKKAGKLMHRLFSKDELPKSMKWDHFVKALVQMGFEYHPETAGSSVRFDPPSKNDRPIHFHKPHPDSTINPVMLQAFRKKLEKYYGWTADQFIDFDENAQVEEID